MGWLGVLLALFGFPGGSDRKESACNVGDLGSIPGLGRSPGGGHGNPFQYSCLENPMDKRVWWVTVCGVTKKLDTTEWLSTTQHIWINVTSFSWCVGWALGLTGSLFLCGFQLRLLPNRCESCKASFKSEAYKLHGVTSTTFFCGKKASHKASPHFMGLEN